MQDAKERVAPTSIAASGALTIATAVVGVFSGSLALRELPECSEIPIVIVTIYEDKDFRYKALQAGATTPCRAS